MKIFLYCFNLIVIGIGLFLLMIANAFGTIWEYLMIGTLLVINLVMGLWIAKTKKKLKERGDQKKYDQFAKRAADYIETTRNDF